MQLFEKVATIALVALAIVILTVAAINLPSAIINSL